MEINKIICGDCLEIMKQFPANYIDTIITDPPYGLKFMGKNWDKGVPGPPFWEEFMRACKPGAFMLAFGGTRTFHRLTCAIEDAGWQIRDCMMYLYGSGFPKSYNISRALEKKGKNELAQLWKGMGTALKPAWEIILCAEKPLTYKEFTAIMAHKIKETLCQLKLFVKTVEKNFLLNHQGQNVVCPDSAVWLAVEKCNTPEDLLGLTDTLPSELEIPLSLSIGLLWLNTLAEVYLRWSTFTTEMATGLTTDLKILNFLQSMLTPANLIQVATGQLGIESNAEHVASLFSAVKMKLNGIPDVSVQDNVISKAHHTCRGGLVPNWEPIVVAMKPKEGTFAANAEKWEVAGLNIDGGRIKKAADDRTEYGVDGIQRKNNNIVYGKQSGTIQFNGIQGRWPANLILDEQTGAMLDRQSGVSKSIKSQRGKVEIFKKEKSWIGESTKRGHNDSGGASRFFYCAKASKSERGRDNKHPTVKPLALMEYLCKLTRTPTGGIVLDPFAGSGTTALACMKTGRDYVLIEKEEKYCEIARKRLEEI